MISLITAFDEKGLIGKDFGLPWDIPEDLKYFKKTTLGKTVIMGLTTYQSMGRLLPKRENVIATLDNTVVEGATMVYDLEAYLKTITEEKEVFIIGGAMIYKIAENYADRLYVTHIAGEYEGNVYFPEYDWDKFEQTSKVVSNNLTFAVYDKKKV